MPSLLLMALAVAALACGLILTLGRRGRPAGSERVAEPRRAESLAARDAPSAEVRSLADALTEAGAPAGLSDPGQVAAPSRVAAAVVGSPPATPVAHTIAPAWDPTPRAAADLPQLATAYAALSEDLLAESRCAESALARWAADLHVLGDRLAGREDDVVRALGPDAPADRRQSPRAPVALDAVTRARYRVGAVLAAAVPLPALPDAATLPRPPESPAPVQHEPRHALLERAALGVTRARMLAVSDPVAARRLAWESDLAAFDAVLLDSARHAGDLRLVSVRLRRQLALRLLAAERDPEMLAATLPGDVLPAVHRVRGLLLACLEPHERPALESALGAWADDSPPGPGSLGGTDRAA